MFRKVTKT